MIQCQSGGRCSPRSEIKRRPPSISARQHPSPGCSRIGLARAPLAAEPFAEGAASAPAPGAQEPT
jgi:hypothetical protein